MKLSKKAFALLLFAGALTMSACGTTVSSTSNPPSSQSSNIPTSSSAESSSSSKKKDSKDAFKKLGDLSSFTANIQNATSLGLAKQKKSSRPLRRNLDDGEDEEYEVTNTLVMTTTDYSADDPSASEDGTVDVSFTKIDTTVTTTTTEGRKTLIASLKDGDSDEVVVKEYGEDTITFNSDSKHEYRVLDRFGEVVQDWKVGQDGTTITDPLPVALHQDYSDFTLYQRYVHYYKAIEIVDIFSDFGDLLEIDSANKTVTFPILKDKTTKETILDVDEHEYELTDTYLYRLVDGSNDNVIIDWKSFNDVSGNQGSFVVEGDFPANPKVERKQTNANKAFSIESDAFKYNYGPVKRVGNSISFNVTGPYNGVFRWEKNGMYEASQYALKDYKGGLATKWYEAEKEGRLVIDELTFKENITSKHFSVEARSIDAAITYPAYPGFKYTLKDLEDHVIYEDVEANSSDDASSDETLIMFDGLNEGQKYVLYYTGVGEETVVEQSKVGGEIDKMFVYNDQFTFVSFVPYGTSSRPEEPRYEKDGIANYDKRDYYSDDNRQSFIFDNYSGYIYLIKDFHVKYIHNGLLLSNDDDLVYDFRINEDDDLEIFALFTNVAIKYYNFFKDKYGNNIIQNNLLNEYDETTNTYFYIAKPNANELLLLCTLGDSEYSTYLEASKAHDKVEFEEADRIYDLYLGPVNKLIESARNLSGDVHDRYYLTNDNETLYVKYHGDNLFQTYYKDAYLLLGEGNNRELTISDDIYAVNYADSYDSAVRVKNGFLYTLPAVEDGESYYNTLYKRNNDYFVLNLLTGKQAVFSREYDWLIDFSYMSELDTLLVYDSTNSILYSVNFDTDLNEYIAWDDIALWGDDNDSNICPFYMKNMLEQVIDKVTINSNRDSFDKFSASGTISYEIVVEEKDGEVTVTPYVVGTYEAPEKIVVLQPINR